MKLQCATAGIPSPNERTKPIRMRVSRNRTMPSTLGAVPMVVRSLANVNGARAGCQYTKKRNRRARKAGYQNAEVMAAALAEVQAKAAGYA